jgi:uncharacterized protein YbcI
MAELQAGQQGRSVVLMAVSNAMVALHKEQFGRGPTKARTHWAGDDTLVSVLEGGLLPAELAMIAMGEQQRVRESRLFFQAATRDQFVAQIERLTGRTARAFMSATDPDSDVIVEVCVFDPRPVGRDGDDTLTAEDGHGGVSSAAPRSSNRDGAA